ncbi:DUF5131 family protein [Fodinicurvata sediminis]|uniref:DUF5131 family protein n=1 Tax=Fodinicurvata sediminis TaxID=1121832 RepID=UPI0003B6EE92|nr:phage Gp37/Gp68 family protein [Fodinicurvata sediminis]
MSDKSKIEWTDATWNPVTGCSIVSPGCTNCYAMKLAGGRMKHHPSRAGLTDDSKAGPVWNGRVRLNEQWLDQPLRWKKPRHIFVCAHGDLFHENVPDEWIDRVFAVMALAPQHTFQVLTKRAGRMKWYMDRALGRIADAVQPMRTDRSVVGPLPHVAPGRQWWPLHNVWLMVSIEDQQRVNERIPRLLLTPAAVRGVSAEPLLGPLDLTPWLPGCYECADDCGWRSGRSPEEEICNHCGWIGTAGGEFCSRCAHQDFGHVCPNCEGNVIHHHPDTPCLDWVIAGGESGPGARPMHPDWPRSLRDQCQAAGVAFHFKQWGEWHPDALLFREAAPDGRCPPPKMRVGKRAAGRTLDGRTWDEMPEVRS